MRLILYAAMIVVGVGVGVVVGVFFDLSRKLYEDTLLFP